MKEKLKYSKFKFFTLARGGNCNGNGRLHRILDMTSSVDGWFQRHVAFCVDLRGDFNLIREK